MLPSRLCGACLFCTCKEITAAANTFDLHNTGFQPEAEAKAMCADKSSNAGFAKIITYNPHALIWRGLVSTFV